MKIFRKQAVTFFLVFVLSISSYGQSKSERNKNGYFGMVQSVRTESINFSFDAGKQQRGKRKLASIKRFDKHGRLLEELYLKDDGSVLWSYKYIYNSQGRVIESSGKQDRFVYLPDRETYKYDPKGNVVEECGYDSNGKLVNKDEYVYDEKNRKTQWTSMSYHPTEHSHPHRWTYTYDEEGEVREIRAFVDEGEGFKPTDSLGSSYRRLNIGNANDKSLSILSFNVDGTFNGLELIKYDRRGNEIEFIKYDESGSVIRKARYNHKFDRFGNLVRLNTYAWVREHGRAFYQLRGISYHQIKYFN